MRTIIIAPRSVIVSLLVAFCLLACDHDDTDKTLIAICDQVTTARGIAVTVDVIGNDTDSSGNELTLADVTQAMHGTVTINTDDTVTYIPVPDLTEAIALATR